MSALILALALLLHRPAYQCNADVYIPESPCATHSGQTCVEIRKVLCF